MIELEFRLWLLSTIMLIMWVFFCIVTSVYSRTARKNCESQIYYERFEWR